MTVFEMNNRIEEAFNPTIDKYAMYLRKSRADIEAEKDGDGETLARHKKILTDLAVKKGLYIEKIYEEVVSGETIESREAIKTLIQDCYAGKYKGVLVIDISRLSRGNQGDAQTILDCIRFSNSNRGILIITPTKTYDIVRNHDDEEYMEFELFMSRREYKMIKRRLDRGKIQAVVEGNYIGSKRPYGYNIVKTKKSRSLEPHPDEAPIVKQMFEWAATEHISAFQIAKRLDAMGIPSYHNTRWSKSSVQNVLTNTIYIGKVSWFKRVSVKTMDDGEMQTKLTKYTDQKIEYDGKHEAIISQELFDACRIKQPTARTRANYDLINPLAGILVCARCKRVLAFKHYANGPRPRFRHPYPNCSDLKSVFVSDVMDALKHSLKLQIEDMEIKLSNMGDINIDDMSNQIALLQAEIKKQEMRKSKLFDGWEDGTITDNEFVERKTVISNRIEIIQDRIQEIERTIPEEGIYSEKVSSLYHALDMIDNPDIEAKLRNDYLKTIIDTIEFDRENSHEFILDVTFK